MPGAGAQVNFTHGFNACAEIILQDMHAHGCDPKVAANLTARLQQSLNERLVDHHQGITLPCTGTPCLRQGRNNLDDTYIVYTTKTIIPLLDEMKFISIDVIIYAFLPRRSGKGTYKNYHSRL